MGTIARRLAVVAVFAAVVAAGCSKDETVASTATTTPVTASSGGGAGTTEPDDADKDKDKDSGEYAEVCAIIEEIDQSDGEDMGVGVALFEDARDAGPEELAAHWDTLAEIFGELDALGESDEAMTRAFELLEDPEFLEAAAAIDDFAEEECGLDIGLDPTEEDATGGRVGDDEIGVPTDTTDPDEDPTSIDALQAHLEAEYGTEAWWPIFDDATSWGSSGSSSLVEWEVVLSSSSDVSALTASDLEAACDAMADYLDTYEDGDVSIEIADSDDTVLVSRAPGEACAAA